jgi:acyl dehydratase
VAQTRLRRRELRELPNLLPLYARAAAGLLPGAALLPWFPGGSGLLPALELAADGVLIERERLAAYNAICGFAQTGEVPATYLHILAFPLQMALMADGRFPFSPVGLVHIENEITSHRALEPEVRVALRVRAGALAAHPRGRSFALDAQAYAEGELIWSERSLMLKVGARAGAERTAPAQVEKSAREDARESADAARDSAAEAREDAEGPSGAQGPLAEQEWECPADLGRRYGAISGDRNPIHMHPLAARIFGFRSAIAHGMWSKARALAALSGELPERYRVQVSFRRPILLPARVCFARQAGAGAERAIAFSLRSAQGEQLHLQGRVQAL